MPSRFANFSLQVLSDTHRDAFAAMQSDAEVMADLGGPADRTACDEKFDRYCEAWANLGISRWAVIGVDEQFLGYCGVMFRADPEHPLGPHHEVGWRLCREAWGQGLATRSAELALRHAWTVLSSDTIWSYTAVDNLRSQAVMNRLGLKRVASRDFTARYARGDWSGLVWAAKRP